MASFKNTLFDEEEYAIKKRNEICKMLEMTRDVDRDSNYGGSCTVRYYYMTNDEFERIKPYTFTIFIGDIHNDQSHKHSTRSKENDNSDENDVKDKLNNCEGFCYDISRVMREEYMAMDLRVPHIPIPLSEDRWNKLCGAYKENLFIYSRETGKLAYPLLKEEWVSILNGIVMKKNPVICSVGSSCKPVSIEMLDQLRLQVKSLYDESSEHRYGPPDTLKTETKGQTQTGWSKVTCTVPTNNDENDKLQLKVDKTIEMVSKELSDIDLLTPKVLSRLQSNETRKYVETTLKANAEVEQVAGMLVDDVLNLIFDQAPNPESETQ